MGIEVGSILEGKVTGITKFGAFVQLPGGFSGLVHISEIAHAYVNDVHDYLSDGQSVKVKVLGIDEAGKIKLSIKQTEPRPAPAQRSSASAANSPRPFSRPQTRSSESFASSPGQVSGPGTDASFEDKLKTFMKESDSRVSGNKLYAEKKTNRRRK